MSKNSLAKAEKSSPNQNNQFIKICFHILFFVTPLLLWPFTSEVFEFNKMIFVYLMTTIIATGWLMLSIKNKKFELAKTPLDIPILLFFLSQLISTILSINPHTSLWGYYSRFHGGLMSTISYIILYYAFATHFAGDAKGIFSIIKTILATASITAIYGVLEHFGIDKKFWVQDVQNRVFSTLGQPNWLSAYLIAILPIPLYLSFTNKSLYSRTIYFSLSALFLLTIIYTKSQSGLGATAVVLLLFVIYLLKRANKLIYSLALIPLIIAVFFIPRTSQVALRTLKSLNNTNPFYSNTLDIAKIDNVARGNGGSDSMVIRRVVWDGAIALGKKYPFFGSGVETFGYAYYSVRPVAHNFTSETDFLYNKAHNEYLNFLGTTGFFGLLTYLFLIFSILKIFSKKSDNRDLSSDISTPLLLGVVSILITNYFGFSVVNIGLFFFLFPAIAVSLSDNLKNSIFNLNFKDNFLPISVLIILSLFSLNKVRNIWLADIYYNKGKSNLEANQIAVKLNPSEPVYISQLGQIQSLIVSQIIWPQMGTIATAEPEIRQKAENYLKQYVDGAIANTQKAVAMNPYNLNLYKNKARTEIALAVVDPKFNNSVSNTLLKIIELSPTDPANYQNLGIIYKTLGNKEEATRAFNKVLELYPNHQGAKDQLTTLATPSAKTQKK